MVGRIILFVSIIMLLTVGLMFAYQYWVMTPKKSKDEQIKAKAKSITHRKTLCAQVDSYIVDTELNGEQAPLSLLKARVNVDEAPNDETRAYAVANLEKEFLAVKKQARKKG